MRTALSPGLPYLAALILSFRSQEAHLLKALFGLVTGLCVASTQAMAIDAIWYCSSLEKSHPKPDLFKVEIKGGEVFTLTSAQKDERYFDRMEGAKQKF
jgi:hypothetical protein